MVDAESWKRMVLRFMPKPAWLSADAPNVDVVLSSRTRVMRNVRGFRFAHRASQEELSAIMSLLIDATQMGGPPVEVFKSLTTAERDHLVACRLVSPDFPWTLPGRALLVNPERSLSLMINEEDHLRLQALTPGWSVLDSERTALDALRRISAHVEFAFSPSYGYLSASPFNLGRGRRDSAMFHLIGLAHSRRLPDVIKALLARGISVRGLFGESSRAIGAFVQVSVINRSREEFAGACEYLLREERSARSSVKPNVLRERAYQAMDLVLASQRMGLADALRVVAWLRWAASSEVGGFPTSLRALDEILSTLEIRGGADEHAVSRERALSLRAALQG